MKTTTKLTSLALLSALSCSVASAALPTTTTFDGNGSLVDVAEWDNGLPTNANPGLISATTNAWLGTAWTDVAVRQTGGEIVAVANGHFAMRGGALNSGNTTILEIDDASNADFSTTNLTISGTLTFWKQHGGGGGHELSLLNGYATVGSLNAGSGAATSTINILNGKLDIGTLTAAKVQVNMLSGGTGEIVLADQSGSLLNSMRLDFASDSLAGFTILQKTGGGNAGGYWQFFVGKGWVTIDGVVVTDLSQFDIQRVGETGTRIQRAGGTGAYVSIPEPFSAALLFGMVSFGSLALRRR